MPSLEELEARLKAAHDAYHEQRKKNWDLEESLRIRAAINTAEADLFEARGESYVRSIDIGFEYSVDDPTLLQSPWECFLVVDTFTRQAGVITDRGYAVLKFDYCMWTTFGCPNDEAIEGHPMSGRGLDLFEVCEVFNSPWITRMRDQNRVSFPDSYMGPVRHLIFTFKENTFECLCAGIEVVFTHSDHQTVLSHATSLLFRK